MNTDMPTYVQTATLTYRYTEILKNRHIEIVTYSNTDIWTYGNTDRPKRAPAGAPVIERLRFDVNIPNNSCSTNAFQHQLGPPFG